MNSTKFDLVCAFKFKLLVAKISRCYIELPTSAGNLVVWVASQTMDVDRAGVVTRLREPVARRNRWVVPCARAGVVELEIERTCDLRGRAPKLEGDSAATTGTGHEKGSAKW
jgi:hypothetical protein